MLLVFLCQQQPTKFSKCPRTHFRTCWFFSCKRFLAVWVTSAAAFPWSLLFTSIHNAQQMFLQPDASHTQKDINLKAQMAVELTIRAFHIPRDQKYPLVSGELTAQLGRNRETTGWIISVPKISTHVAIPGICDYPMWQKKSIKIWLD